MKTPLAVIVVSFLVALPMAAAAESRSTKIERQNEISKLVAELAQPELETWESVESRLIGLWSRSGSATADLLLERGQSALEREDYQTAIEHLTALTDHAPDFAEGWQARATAFYSIQEFGLAIEDLQRALSLNPQHFGAMIGMGIVLEELGDFELALKAMRLAFNLNPHREIVSDAIERLEYQLGNARL